jgi:hypothetical protein
MWVAAALVVLPTSRLISVCFPAFQFSIFSRFSTWKLQPGSRRLETARVTHKVCVTDLLTTGGNPSSISTSHIGDGKKTGLVLEHETRTATLNPLCAGGGCYDIVWDEAPTAYAGGASAFFSVV